MQENEITAPDLSGRTASFIIVQAVTVVLLLLSVLTVKYFFKEYYEDISRWYKTSFCGETDVDEVLKAAGGDIDEV